MKGKVKEVCDKGFAFLSVIDDRCEEDQYKFEKRAEAGSIPTEVVCSYTQNASNRKLRSASHSIRITVVQSRVTKAAFLQRRHRR